MKLSPFKLATGLIAALGVVGVGYAVINSAYLKPAARLRDQIAGMDATYERASRVMEDWPKYRGQLRDFGRTLIGSEFDQVEHRLRTSLQAIGEQSGLRGVQVSNGRPKAERTPLATARLRGSLGRKLAESTDFGIIKGAFKGVGTLEQVVQAMAVLQVQPWLHRIDRVSIAPRGRERVNFELDVAFSVMFAPDLCPAEAGMPAIVEPGEDVLTKVRAIAARNVFVAPPPDKPDEPPVVEPEREEVAPPPPPPPYDRWKVTGLVERRVEGTTVSVEAWVLNLDSGERRILTPGDEILGHVLEWVDGERGYFVFEGRRVVIAQGQTLADRVPADPVNSPESDGSNQPASGATAGEGE